MRDEWVEVDGRVVAARVGHRQWPQVHEGISEAVSVPRTNCRPIVVIRANLEETTLESPGSLGYFGDHRLFLI